MAARRGGLGRGLDALIPGSTGGAPRPEGASPRAAAADALPAANGAIDVEIGRVERNPHQPRKQIDDERLTELAESIRAHGVLQPLVVTRLEDVPGTGQRYRLIAGERRWRAAKRAGLVRVPVVVREATPRQFLELALVENVQRADLNAIEEAAAYQQLTDDFGLTQEEIGKRVGKNRVTVANTLRLLQLPAAVQQAVIDGAVTEGHARALLQLRDRTAQERVAQQIVERGLSVRETEDLVRRTLHGPRVAPPRRLLATADDAQEIEGRFRDALGTKVTLSPGKRGGRLVIFYYDDEQLQALYERLAGSEDSA